MAKSDSLPLPELEVFTVYDRKLRQFGPLVVERNKEVLIRVLVDSIGGSKSLMEQHPRDFDLYFVGTFDNSAGRIEGFSVPQLVANLYDLLIAESENGVPIS